MQIRSSSRKPTDALPTFDEFEQAIDEADGSAGFDGWTARELKMIKRLFSFMIRELYELWCATARIAAFSPDLIPQKLRMILFSWRTVGIPKKVEDQSRPIGVASVLLRGWLSACANAFPQPVDWQWACKQGIAVIHAAADWLQACAQADEGSEMDLTECYDMVDDAIAEDALRREGMPTPTRAVATLAWTGPRHCHIDDEVCQNEGCHRWTTEPS